MGGSEMTDEEINIKIAEACGWEDRGSFDHMFPENHLYRRQLNDGSGGYEYSSQKKFNYCGDLNAMHDAENWIIANKSSLWLFQDYAQNLRKNFQTLGLDGYIHSTARQRAEAFLRTIGKWKEEAK
jgi:hypothetical protein